MLIDDVVVTQAHADQSGDTLLTRQVNKVAQLATKPRAHRYNTNIHKLTTQVAVHNNSDNK